MQHRPDSEAEEEEGMRKRNGQDSLQAKIKYGILDGDKTKRTEAKENKFIHLVPTSSKNSIFLF